MNLDTELIGAENGKVRIKAKCHVCGKEFTSKPFDEAQYTAWRDLGLYAQDAFPEWSVDEREFFLISGTCGECFAEMFGV